AVDLPADLVPASHVQDVMHHICARYIVGDHRQTVGAIRSGGLGNSSPVDQSGWSNGIWVDDLGLRGDANRLLHLFQLQLKVQDGRTIGIYGDGLLEDAEADTGDGEPVVA